MSEPICTKCGDVAYVYDEATEFCESCYEHEMGEPMPEENYP